MEDGESEIIAFSEVIVQILSFMMQCPAKPHTLYFIAENDNANDTVYLLIINNNHFNILRLKGLLQ